jgi:hypothetical protein
VGTCKAECGVTDNYSRNTQRSSESAASYGMWITFVLKSQARYPNRWDKQGPRERCVINRHVSIGEWQCERCGEDRLCFMLPKNTCATHSIRCLTRGRTITTKMGSRIREGTIEQGLMHLMCRLSVRSRQMSASMAGYYTDMLSNHWQLGLKSYSNRTEP